MHQDIILKCVAHLGVGAGSDGDGALCVVDEAVSGQQAGQGHAPRPHLPAHLRHAGLHAEHALARAAVRGQLHQVGHARPRLARTRLLLPALPGGGVVAGAGPPLDVEGDGLGAAAGLVVHQDVQRTLLLLQHLLPRRAAAQHAALAPVLGHAEVGLDEAEVRRLPPVYRVLVQHLLHHPGRRVVHRQQQRLVRHVLPQTLAVDLQRAARVGT